MKRATGSLRKPILPMVLVGLAEIILLGGLWWGVTRQIAGMNQAVNDIGDLKDPSPYRVALLGHLGKIHLGLQGYLRSTDASLLDQVAQSRKDFDAALPDFQQQNPKLFPKAAVEEIRRAFGVYKEAIDHTLEVNAKRTENRTRLDQNFVRILLVIDKDIRPLIRGDQAEIDERKEAILNIENQARAWQQNLVKAWEQPTHAATELTFENENRGESFLERYGRMELLSRERKMQKEIRALWQTNSDLGRESFAIGQVVSESESFMEAQRGQVVSALNKYLPAMPPAELANRKQGYVRSMRLHGVAVCLIALIGIVSLGLAVRGIFRLKRGEPLIPPRPIKLSTESEGFAVLKDSTVQMDLKGKIIDWTAAAEKLYGYSSGEVKGQSISMLFESESEISRLYQDLLEKPQTSFETIHKIKGGNAVPVRIEFRPVTDSTGRPTAIGLVCTRR